MGDCSCVKRRMGDQTALLITDNLIRFQPIHPVVSRSRSSLWRTLISPICVCLCKARRCSCQSRRVRSNRESWFWHQSIRYKVERTFTLRMFRLFTLRTVFSLLSLISRVSRYRAIKEGIVLLPVRVIWCHRVLLYFISRYLVIEMSNFCNHVNDHVGTSLKVNIKVWEHVRRS